MTPIVSAIIPTHNPKFLRETVASALQIDDMEVVIVPNGDCDSSSLDGVIQPKDSRVVVKPFTKPTKSVGAVKRFGFDVARGQILIELDHDDLLAPGAIKKLVDRFATGADFVYSNFAEFEDQTWKPREYKECGWKARDAEGFGHPLREMIAFDPSPFSIGYLWFAPNHVRAWTREAYARAGKHDPKLEICDDQDLLQRTYLTGKMSRIDECLYFQRMHANSTTVLRNSLIQSKIHELYAQRIDALVRHSAKLRNLPCYDLGGAHNPASGWLPADVRLDKKMDLSGRWPWPDSSVGAFRAFDFLEHLPDKLHTMSEIYRCLAPGGWLLSCTPSANGSGAFADPTHVSFWVPRTFLYWTDRELAKYIGNTSVRFQSARLIETTYEFRHDWVNHGNSEQLPYVTFDGIALKNSYSGPGDVRI